LIQKIVGLNAKKFLNVEGKPSAEGRTTNGTLLGIKLCSQTSDNSQFERKCGKVPAQEKKKTVKSGKNHSPSVTKK